MSIRSSISSFWNALPFFAKAPVELTETQKITADYEAFLKTIQDYEAELDREFTDEVVRKNLSAVHIGEAAKSMMEYLIRDDNDSCRVCLESFASQFEFYKESREHVRRRMAEGLPARPPANENLVMCQSPGFSFSMKKKQ